MNAQAQAVFDFWFAGTEAQRREWFQKDDAFDREIERRFGDEIAQVSCTVAIIESLTTAKKRFIVRQIR